VREKEAVVTLGLTLLSVTCTEKESVSGVLGVPVMLPVVELRLRPVGSVPDVIEYSYGAVPPVAKTREPYGVPTVPFNSDGVAMVSGSTTVIENCLDAASEGFDPSVACAVKTKVPGEVGTPSMMPVLDSRLRPFGSDPEVTDHE
jgi:hypothetical protein